MRPYRDKGSNQEATKRKNKSWTNNNTIGWIEYVTANKKEMKAIYHIYVISGLNAKNNVSSAKYRALYLDM